MRTIGNTPVDGEVRAVASGALANGDTVIVNADGTVSVVAETSVSQAVGSPVVFESATVGEASGITFDSSSNKVVISYKDGGNSNYGTAIVGTVSGTSISFGTPVVFESAQIAGSSLSFDSSSSKIVIAYMESWNLGHGVCKVATVSGTNISVGTRVTFNASSSSGISSVFDSNANKVVICYRDGNNSGRATAIVGTVSGTNISFGSESAINSVAAGTTRSTFDSNSNKVVVSYLPEGYPYGGKVSVGTVSGTSISFGIEAEYHSGLIIYPSITFDSNSNKVVLAWSDYPDSGKGKARIGTVSGTNIGLGSTVTFNNANTAHISATFDSNANKVVLAYQDLANPSDGDVIVGTVSGTSISFGTGVQFEAGITKWTSSTFDSNLNKVVVAYMDDSNSDYGTSVVFQNDFTSTTLTSENYIGIAKGAAADTAVATVQTGCSINDAQSSLTAGQDYFVQTDGTLGLTAADPSVFAGTAVSATEIIVKG